MIKPETGSNQPPAEVQKSPSPLQFLTNSVSGTKPPESSSCKPPPSDNPFSPLSRELNGSMELL